MGDVTQNVWLTVWRALAVALTMLLAAEVGGGVQAAERASGDWERLDAVGPVHRLFTPTSGAFLAAGDGKLLRSDDAGATWREVALPPDADLSFGLGGSYTPRPIGQGRLAVVPTNHDVLYVAAAAGLQKSTDGGMSWQALPVDGSVVAVAISPADPAYVHVVVRGPANLSEWRRLRSRDGGATWEQVSSFTDRSRPPADYEIYLLRPHPTDPERVFVAAGGTTGRSTQVRLYDSYDGPGPRHGPALEFQPGFFRDAERLVGGSGATPGRFYAAFNDRVSPYDQGTRTLLLRADEGGPQATLFESSGAGAPFQRADGEVLPPAEFVDGLAYDPAAPDRVYVGINEYAATVARSPGEAGKLVLTRARSRVMASTDGGSTWSDIGPGDFGGEVRDLVLGIDRANLYAATEQGVWQLRLSPAAGR